MATLVPWTRVSLNQDVSLMLQQWIIFLVMIPMPSLTAMFANQAYVPELTFRLACPLRSRRTRPQRSIRVYPQFSPVLDYRLHHLPCQVQGRRQGKGLYEFLSVLNSY